MKRAFFTVFAMVLWVASAMAQSRDTSTYTLKPEDIVRIQVYGRQEIAAEVPVGIDGNITAPFIGSVIAEGRTTIQIQDDLTKLYQKKLGLRDPIVSVTIVAFRRLRASISGMVQRPTEFIFRPGDTIMTLVSAGGGAVPDRADTRRATLRRQGSKEIIPIDLYALTVLGDNTQNYELKDGDVLDVPEEQRNRILVMGAIRQQGMYPYRETMRLADAIAVAGGEIRYLSRFSKCYVLRELPGRPGEYIRIDADYVKFVKGGDFSQNVKLMPGDMVYVPETNTPDLNQFQGIVNSLFIIRSFGGLF